jgi:hypothetical protein
MEYINNKNYNEIIIFKKEYEEYDLFILDNGKKRKIEKYKIDNNIIEPFLISNTQIIKKT